jgi:hypothetical protein
MVIVRIKNNGNNVASKISDNGIKIVPNLKICKVIEDSADERVEKKIEFITPKKFDKPINTTLDDYNFSNFDQRSNCYISNGSIVFSRRNKKN